MTKYIDTEPLKTEIKKLAAEITRLLAENEYLKKIKTKNIEHLCDVCTKQSVIEEAKTEGADAAWELARKITCQPINGGFNRSEFEKIFDEGYISDIFEKYTYTEAATKVAEWEKTKEEIKVGDVLENIYVSKVKCVVTNLCPDNMAYLVFDDSTTGICNLNDFKKTGRHINIDSFLKQIGGEQE